MDRLPLQKKHPRVAFSLRGMLLGMLITGIVGLVLYNVRDIILGAPFSISTARDGDTLSDTFLPIVGDARHARAILINGRSVAVDQKGHFTDGAILSVGYNIVEVAVQDRFGKQKTRTYHLVVEPTTAVARTNTISLQQ